MDTKYKDDLFRKYVQFHEGKVDSPPSKQRPDSDEYLRVAASALLSLHKVDPFYRFRLIQFYEVVERSLRSLGSSSLRALHCAFSLLETMGVNLFLYPWKKEFKSIKVRPKVVPSMPSSLLLSRPFLSHASCVLRPSGFSAAPGETTRMTPRAPYLVCLSTGIPTPGCCCALWAGAKGLD